MARDPIEVLGIAADASLADARAAYRRLAALFHPDHLQGMRADVRAEGERRLREATEAIEVFKAGYRARVRPRPATTPKARSYNAQIRATGGAAIHADWGGPHAAAVWRALRRAHTVDGPVRQVEWGAYECTLTGSELRDLLGNALQSCDDWRREPLETFSRASVPLAPQDLGWLSEQVEDNSTYLVTAEVF